MALVDDDDDVPQLSAETFAALSEFYLEQEEKEKLDGSVDLENITEDWQLSQFWYSPDTAESLARHLFLLSN